MRLIAKAASYALSLMLLAGVAAITATAQDNDNTSTPLRDESQTIVSQLGSRDAQVRQRAAEELARRADTEQLKAVGGYRLQEKNARVRVALDWALYRMGKNEALFALVRSLDSTEGDQAAAYLVQLDTPQPLYIFLGRTKRVAQVRLLEVLAEIGDAETLERIKPALESFEPPIAVAAEHATEQINNRLAQKPAEAQPSRPRQVGTNDAATP
jgi:hypothetical protein